MEYEIRIQSIQVSPLAQTQSTVFFNFHLIEHITHSKIQAVKLIDQC